MSIRATAHPRLVSKPRLCQLGAESNYKLGRGLTAYGNLRNALDQHYEEVFGYPSRAGIS